MIKSVISVNSINTAKGENYGNSNCIAGRQVL
jgi:hypothetical protein